ncbi:MAG: hypothetical protein R3A52_04275 [Polyangiales bacterium]
MACGLNLELGWEGVGRPIVSRDMKGTVHVEGEISVDVKMLPILQDEAMRALLQRVLAEKGWEKSPDGSMSKRFGSATATLSADGKTVTLKVEKQSEVSGRASVQQQDDESDTKAEQRAEREAEKNLEAEKGRVKTRLEEEGTRALLREEPGLRAALQEALNRVYREALEQRARELGEVESVQERGDVGGDYEVTVVVRA